ncbi:MAG: hypothetical protein NVSMB65_13410 [Chloroflexota bacterium]
MVDVKDGMTDTGSRHRVNDLDGLGVVGLRVTDLQEANVACCGDCRFLALKAGPTGAQVATCSRGYTTTLYSTWAADCPDFSLRAALPDEPQGDDRARRERRVAVMPVAIDRRSGRDRRAAS